MKTKRMFSAVAIVTMLTLLMTTSIFVTPTFAKKAKKEKVKTITIKKDYLNEQDKSIIDKVVIPVKNNTTYMIKNKLKSGCSILKFIVPSDGTYVFTASDVKQKKKDDYLIRSTGVAYIAFHKTHEPISPNKVIGNINVKTKGGLTNTLWIGSKNDTNKYADVKNRYYKKRTGTVKLSKGQEVYMWVSGNSNVVSYKLSIKKK